MFLALLCLHIKTRKEREKRKDRQKKKEKRKAQKRKNAIIHIFFLLFPACSIPFRIFSKATLVIRLFNKRVITFTEDSFSRNTVGPKEARSQLPRASWLPSCHSYSCQGSGTLLSFSLDPSYSFWETEDCYSRRLLVRRSSVAPGVGMLFLLLGQR